jgi:hypothetical protein
LKDLAGMRAHRLAEDARLAGGRAQQVEQHAQGGGLAGAVGTEKAEDFARLDADDRRHPGC